MDEDTIIVTTEALQPDPMEIEEDEELENEEIEEKPSNDVKDENNIKAEEKATDDLEGQETGLETGLVKQEPGSSKWKSHYDFQRKYQPSWEKRFPWVTKAKDGTEYAYCKVCQKMLFPKLSILAAHDKSSEHIKNFNAAMLMDTLNDDKQHIILEDNSTAILDENEGYIVLNTYEAASAGIGSQNVILPTVEPQIKTKKVEYFDEEDSTIEIPAGKDPSQVLSSLCMNVDAREVLKGCGNRLFEDLTLWDIMLGKAKASTEAAAIEVLLKDFENVMVELKLLLEGCFRTVEGGMSYGRGERHKRRMENGCDVSELVGHALDVTSGYWKQKELVDIKYKNAMDTGVLMPLLELKEEDGETSENTDVKLPQEYNKKEVILGRRRGRPPKHLQDYATPLNDENDPDFSVRRTSGSTRGRGGKRRGKPGRPPRVVIKDEKIDQDSKENIKTEPVSGGVRGRGGRGRGKVVVDGGLRRRRIMKKEKMAAAAAAAVKEEGATCGGNGEGETNKSSTLCNKCGKMLSTAYMPTHEAKCDGLFVRNPSWKKVGEEYMCTAGGCTINHGFDSMYGLRVHFYASHLRDDEKVYSCEHCDAKFPDKISKNKHIKLAHLKPYQCDHCGRRFGSRSKLASHKMTHTGEKPFACDRCDYKTAKKYNLDEHKQKKHNDLGGRNYYCGLCGKVFYSPGRLTSHFRIVHQDGKNPEGGLRKKSKAYKERLVVQQQAIAQQVEAQQAEGTQQVLEVQQGLDQQSGELVTVATGPDATPIIIQQTPTGGAVVAGQLTADQEMAVDFITNLKQAPGTEGGHEEAITLQLA